MKTWSVIYALIVCFISSCSGGGGEFGLHFDYDTPTIPPPPPPELGETFINVWPISGSEIQISLCANKGSYEITSYEIFKDNEPICTISNDSWTDSHLALGYTHCYSASAIDSAGNRAVQSVSKCATTGWVSEVVDFSSGPSQIRIHRNDSPRIGYVAADGVRTSIKQNGVWAIEIASNIEAFFDDLSDNVLYVGPYITALSLMVDSNDTASIFYNLLEDVHDFKYSLWKVTQSGIAWDAQRICFDCTSEDNFNVAFDDSNKAYLSFINQQYNNYQGLAVLNETTPDAWNLETIESEQHRLVSSPSIEIDQNGKLNIFFADLENQTIKYLNNIQDTWAASIIAGPITKTLFDTTISSAIDSSGKLHVIYYDRDTDSLIYANHLNGNWAFSTIAQEDGGELNSIAIGLDDSIHVVYASLFSEALKYATNKGGSWARILIESTGVGQTGLLSPSIALDSAGIVHISYIGSNYSSAPKGVPGYIKNYVVRHVVQEF